MVLKTQMWRGTVLWVNSPLAVWCQQQTRFVEEEIVKAQLSVLIGVPVTVALN